MYKIQNIFLKNVKNKKFQKKFQKHKNNNLQGN